MLLREPFLCPGLDGHGGSNLHKGKVRSYQPLSAIFEDKNGVGGVEREFAEPIPRKKCFFKKTSRINLVPSPTFKVQSFAESSSDV